MCSIRALSNLVVKDDIVQEIRDALQHFTVMGPLGTLLDAEYDSLGDGQMLAFETENLLQLDDKAVIPVLLYLFRRIEQRPTPKREISKRPFGGRKTRSRACSRPTITIPALSTA